MEDCLLDAEVNLKGCAVVRNIRLLVSYDGTDYHGFQLQENALTIQELLEDALKKLPKNPYGLYRLATDAGVAKVVNFPSTSSIP